MSPSKPVLLLICDTLPADIVAEYGDYHSIFTTLLHSSGVELSIPPSSITLKPYDAVSGSYPTENAVDESQGILITGSKASAYEDIEWINKLVEFVRRVATDKPSVKIVGICFGHQIIGRALGGRVVKNNGKWEVGPTPIELTTLGKEVFGSDSLYIQEMHQDVVSEMPPQFHLLGSTSVALNQGMVRLIDGASPSTTSGLSNIHIFTVQGHPEFTQGLVNMLLEPRLKSGILSAEVVEDARRRAGWRNDGVTVIGKAILGVLGFV
ncbi:Glutamine amidotransferase type-1 domain-containing protein [Mycena indigotica]|uniref:Glutamine amidotransferase type-1 domain-containing protein n=1 Tax=Mycena indigotica TaxID=2126181 RepID=A0A8H6SQ44_9AGAR|nr:Glutamine amidotransferase type-1 domain-containing protein [Mycena indigotica]KAF7303763.1 Glutamine amidotransferase type-1 domain-containing protein [Mycena indigotica]